MRFIGWLFLVGVLCAKPKVLDQGPIGQKACGPCAIVNQLQFGAAKEKAAFTKLKGKTAEKKARHVIKRYGNLVSPTYRDGKPIYRKDGIGWEDMLRVANWVRRDLELPQLKGAYLDRGKAEKYESHLRRTHASLKKSLDAGVKPIISFRSFVPTYYDDLSEWLWDGLLGHYVVLTEIQEEIAEGEKGFRFRFADSATGRVETGYAYISEARNFAAAKGNRKDWKWVANRPFLLVNAPSLRLDTQKQKWFSRTIITLNYAIYLDPEALEER